MALAIDALIGMALVTKCVVTYSQSKLSVLAVYIAVKEVFIRLSLITRRSTLALKVGVLYG